MKTIVAILLLSSAMFVSGCGGPGVTIHTVGIPSGQQRIIVANGIPEMRMDVYVNGELRCQNLKAMDEPFTIAYLNFTGGTSGVNVLVKIYDIKGGHYAGQASRTFYTSPYDNIPQDWLISAYDTR